MTAHKGMKVILHVGLILIHRGKWLSRTAVCLTSQGDTGNHQTEGRVRPESSLNEVATRIIPALDGNGTPILRPAKSLYCHIPLHYVSCKLGDGNSEDNGS